ncbi:MAG: acyl-ACP--UDP-N-acetylglucosamine O-acyltransferase [Pseudobdellovibrionaceae bacterium]|nr:acyl-ACP--UDP-N-acetylglucosamine O-acyltransferase [Bdellovibrionales bacterium]USN48897.1 MAG: acyl-ACP--UDP-N-acetylglucosamine O-acyltransferase [Pseudobdellovibrionaceae bacterium]
MNIHESAVVSPQAKLADDVIVGPFSVIEGDVTIGSGSRIDSHVCIGSPFGKVTIGRNNHILPGAVLGGPPQDLKYDGEKTELILGDNNVIREFVTLNLGTAQGGGVTRIGDHNLLMAYVHIAHDCELGDHIVIANTTQFAGHVKVEDHVKIGGLCGITQFCRLGKYCYIGGDSSVNKDVLPFTIAQGNWATMRATNKVGLERAGFSKDDIAAIHKCIRMVLKGAGTIEEIMAELKAQSHLPESVQYLLDFMHSSKRGLAR